jgi:hypothetical protein
MADDHQGDQHRQRRRRHRDHRDFLGQWRHNQCRGKRQRSPARPDHRGTRHRTNGILFNTGGNLEIENCVIRNFASAGINISPSTTSIFSVSNTIASDNFIGIDVAPSGSAVVKGVLGKVTTNTNNNGILVDRGHTTGASLTVTIDDSVSFVNNFGIQSMSMPGHAATSVFLARSTVTGNGTGVFIIGGTVFTYGDNDINGNITDVSGTLTPVAPR